MNPGLVLGLLGITPTQPRDAWQNGEERESLKVPDRQGGSVPPRRQFSAAQGNGVTVASNFWGETCSRIPQYCGIRVAPRCSWRWRIAQFGDLSNLGGLREWFVTMGIWHEPSATTANGLTNPLWITRGVAPWARIHGLS